MSDKLFLVRCENPEKSGHYFLYDSLEIASKVAKEISVQHPGSKYIVCEVVPVKSFSLKLEPSEENFYIGKPISEECNCESPVFGTGNDNGTLGLKELQAFCMNCKKPASINKHPDSVKNEEGLHQIQCCPYCNEIPELKTTILGLIRITCKNCKKSIISSSDIKLAIQHWNTEIKEWKEEKKHPDLMESDEGLPEDHQEISNCPKCGYAPRITKNEKFNYISVECNAGCNLIGSGKDKQSAIIRWNKIADTWGERDKGLEGEGDYLKEYCPKCEKAPEIDFSVNGDGFTVSCCDFSVTGFQPYKIWNEYIKKWKEENKNGEEKEENFLFNCPDCNKFPEWSLSFNQKIFYIMCPRGNIIVESETQESATKKWNEAVRKWRAEND